MEPRIGKKLNILSPYGFLYSFNARWQEKLTEQTTKLKIQNILYFYNYKRHNTHLPPPK